MAAWTSGEGYEEYIGRWSRLVASEFVRWLDAPTDWKWLDVGCGTGALTGALVDAASPAQVLGVDPSIRYLAHARAHLMRRGISFEVAEAGALPAREAAFDAVVSGLALNFIPEPAQAIQEMRRVVRPGGLVAAYVWDYAGEMQLLRRFWDVAVALDPDARELHEGRRFPLCNPIRLRELFEGCGLAAIAVRPIDVTTVFSDFEDLWQPFLSGQGPAPGYVAALSEERRTELAEHLRARISAAGDGSITLSARSWAIRGNR